MFCFSDHVMHIRPAIHGVNFDERIWLSCTVLLEPFYGKKNSIETFQSDFLCLVKTDQTKSQNSSKHINNWATLKRKQGEINQMNDCIKCFSVYFLVMQEQSKSSSFPSINQQEGSKFLLVFMRYNVNT